MPDTKDQRDETVKSSQLEQMTTSLRSVAERHERADERLARIIHECRREAAETEAFISPAHPAPAKTGALPEERAPSRGLLAGRTARDE